MVLEEYREQAEPYLTPVARWFVHTHPNTMTWLAFFFAVIAGLTFHATSYLGGGGVYILLPGSAMIFLSALFDALDGRVARMRRMESRRGDFLDHVLDRYADVAIIGGISVSPFCDFRIGLLAILGVVFASYMGTQAQAVGVRRNYSGMLARADRLVLLIAAPLAQMGVEMSEWIGWIASDHRMHFTVAGFPVALSIIELMMIWFAVAGHTTAVQRAVSTWNELSERERGEGGDRKDLGKHGARRERRERMRRGPTSREGGNGRPGGDERGDEGK
ncbi:MAG: CDP-alcohol phosphatidyltransferase family protein [Thermoplasmata archaeon]